VRVVADWLPFFAFLYGYDYSRGAADTFGMPVQVESLYELELRLFGIQRQIPSLFLQRHLYVADHVQWWESFVALTYCSHFVAPWAIVGTLYVRNRDRWAQFARRMLTISFAALVTYFLVPAAPPWYAGRVGLTDHIERISTRGWGALHIPIAGQLVSLGQGVVNQVAAIPSLHAGTAFTIAMFFWPRANLWMRALFIVYPAVMVFALVYGGEHYVVDCSLGVLYAVLVEWGCRVWERRRAKPIPSVATT
jgi:hypothetical protein